MNNQTLLGGTVHTLPADLQQSIIANPQATELWQGLTPLGRNEFICWVENAVKDETRDKRIRRTLEEMFEGKRRPCCWMGCPHRTDKDVSPSVKGILERRSK